MTKVQLMDTKGADGFFHFLLKGCQSIEPFYKLFLGFLESFLK